MSPQLKVKKRSGAIVDFESQKIATAVQKAFLDVVKDPKTDEAQAIAEAVTQCALDKYMGSANMPSVEEIQDMVERELMERDYFDVAKAYIIYRYEHAKIREQEKAEVVKKIEERSLLVNKSSGEKDIFSVDKLKRVIDASVAPQNKNNVDIDRILQQVQREVYDGITTEELEKTLVSVTRSMIELDPAYDQLAAQLALNGLYKNVFEQDSTLILDDSFEKTYRNLFKKNIEHGVSIGVYDSRLLDFDLDKVAEYLQPGRDKLFKYFGVATLIDRYLIKDRKAKRTLETPQYFWMRIALGLAINEKEKELWAVRFYNNISTLRFVPSSPTLFHSGTPRPQLSSCYLNTVEDELEHIFKVYGDNAQLSKWAGGIGTDWTNIRAIGSMIKKTGFPSQGVVPFLKIANDVTVAISRSGRKRGATAVYLETWHLDILDFLELRKNTGDERRRTHDINTANWIPDLFMKRVRDGGHWTLFSPSDVPDLHHIYGKKFEEAYVRYEEMADKGEIELFKRMPAADLWKKMLGMLFETGHPWITFKDPSNIRSPQDHVGVIHNSNLCTEITLNTSREETAVCNLGWVNMARHIKDGAFNQEQVKDTVSVGMRMLDNVIDINFYPTPEAQYSNMKHRPVGLGVGGFQDALYQLDIDFASERCIAFADEAQEIISYYSILASTELAKERGAYESFRGSKWDRGLLPVDTIDLLEKERGEVIEVARNGKLDWMPVRESIKAHGMRNSNCMAIAPTASTSNIVGCVPTIEPIYKNIYVESNISGDFTVVNSYLVEDLKKLGLWNEAMLNELKYRDGSVAQIAGIPEALKNKYKEVFEIDMQWLVRAAAYRGKWIDQAQSLNIFFRGSSGRELAEIYLYAWKMGLKTTYYLRTLAATQVEKSTISTKQFGSTHKRDSQKEGVEARMASSASLSASMQNSSPTPTPLSGFSGIQKTPHTSNIRLHKAPESVCESCE